MESCVFCRIIAGELPAAFVHQDARAVVFLDRDQAARGHLLIVPRQHHRLWHELPEDDAAHLGVLAVRWAAIVMARLAPDGYNLLQNNGDVAGQEIRHVHLHIIPRWKHDNLFRGGWKEQVAPLATLHAVAALLTSQSE